MRLSVLQDDALVVCVLGFRRYALGVAEKLFVHRRETDIHGFRCLPNTVF
ncbi:MAG: hypothetical protein GXZ10_06095 [Gammaproteobacteria bacterium]|nr:hypothetical protein [Gammaproteobacteria bacterium]